MKKAIMVVTVIAVLVFTSQGRTAELSAKEEAIIHYNRGVEYDREIWQEDKAIEEYSKAIALDPNFAKAYNNRGSAYVIKGEYDKAIEDINKAIALDSNYAKAYMSRGVAYAHKSQYDRAIEDYNKAITIDSKLPFVYLNRGIAYEEKGIIDKAISDFQKACNTGELFGCEGLQRLQKALKKKNK